MRGDRAQSAGGAGETLSPAERERHCDLMEAVAVRADRQAFAELFTYYAPRLKGYAMRLNADPALAEEIVQDVMAAVWRKAATFDRTQASVSTWLFRIARNRRIDLFRRADKPAFDPEEPLVLPAAVETPDARVEALDAERIVRAAMAELPADQLQIVRLAFYEGYSHSEIAERLTLPLGTVKSRMRLAFAKMKGRLTDE